jgi:hypothetical protein
VFEGSAAVVVGASVVVGSAEVMLVDEAFAESVVFEGRV